MSSVNKPSTSEFSSTTVYYEGPRPHLDKAADFYLWQQQIRQALQKLKQIGRQTAEQPADSFQQAMRRLYGESHFSAFISSRAWQQAGLDERAERELQRLQQLLNNFEEPETDDLLATESDWQTILAQVEAVVTLLPASGTALAND